MESPDLLQVLGRFADSLTEDLSTSEVIDRLTGELLDHLPVVAVNVVLEDGPERRHVAIGSPRADRGGAAPAAVHHGPTASFRLRGCGALLGSLELYSEHDDLEPEHLTTARALADLTGSYLCNTQRRRIAERRADRLRHESLHDPLTGVANRALLEDRLDHAVEVSLRDHTTVGVLFVDVDDFKRFNDDFGHPAGDELLRHIAGRVQSVLRSSDTLARFGGDEFVVVCPALSDPAQASRVADRILGCFTTAFEIAAAPAPQAVQVSIGIAFAGSGLGPGARALEQADDAMYRAKRAGGGKRVTAPGAPCMFENLGVGSRTSGDGHPLIAVPRR